MKSSDLNRQPALLLLLIILLAAFFLRQYKLMDFPFYGDEVDSGDVTLDILHGKIAPFYPEGDGHEALYNYSMAPFFILMGDSEIASRWPSVAWAMVFVALMYVYGQMLFRSRRVGVIAAAFTGAVFWPAMYAHLSLRVVSLPPMTVPALLGLVLTLRDPSDSRARRAAIVGGLFAGLTAYAYTSGRGLPLIVAAFVAYVAFVERQSLRKRWRNYLIYGLLTGIVSLWLYAYLHTHPELDLRVGEMSQTSWFFRGDWSGLVPALSQTLGMFTVTGEPNWVNNISGRPVFVGPEGILFYLGVLLCLVRFRKPEYGLQLIVIGANLIPSLITEHPPSWGRSMGMQPALFVVAALPLEWLWQKIESWTSRRSVRAGAHAVRSIYTILAIALGVSVFARTAYDLFEVWMNAPGVYWMSLAFYSETADYINHSTDSTPLNYVMDFDIPWREHNIERPIQRKEVALRLSVKNAFVFPDDPQSWRIAFQILGDPALALQTTFLDLNHPIYVDPRVDPAGQRPLRVYSVSRTTLDDHLARARQNAVFLPDGTETVVPLPAPVGDTLQFLGYEILNPAARPGDDLSILTYWRVTRRPPALAAFVHLLDQKEQVVAQYDGFDVVGDQLAPGDTVVQLHTLTLPANLPSSTYRLEIGIYGRQDLKRLSFSAGVDHLWLQTWPPAP